VRFIRVAERRIVEGVGHGIVCFITNFSYLHEPGFAQMRRTLLEEFDTISIDNLNGDSRETGKRTPDGKPDPSIFSTPYNRQGIQVGTAVALYVRRPEHGTARARVRYRDFWGESKPSDLLHVVRSDDPEAGYAVVPLTEVNRLAFRPGVFSADYESWPQVVELAADEPLLGLLEKRGSALIDPSREALDTRMQTYLDPAVPFEELRHTDAEELTRPWARFDARATRDRLLSKGGFREERIVRFLTRPLDVQWAYVDPTPKLWNEVRANGLTAQIAGGENRFLLVRRRAPRLSDGAPFLAATCIGEEHALHKDAYFIPFVLRPTGAQDQGLFDSGDAKANLSARALAYLGDLGVDPVWRTLRRWCGGTPWRLPTRRSTSPTTPGASPPTGRASPFPPRPTDCCPPRRLVVAWPISSIRSAPRHRGSRPSWERFDEPTEAPPNPSVAISMSPCSGGSSRGAAP
jgi:hypothetical protein